MVQETCIFPVSLLQGKNEAVFNNKTIFFKGRTSKNLCPLFLRMETLGGSSDDQLPGWRSGSQRKKAVGMVRFILLYETSYMIFLEVLKSFVIFRFTVIEGAYSTFLHSRKG